MIDVLNIIREYGWGGLFLIALLITTYKIVGVLLISASKTIQFKSLGKRQENLSKHAFFNSIRYILNVEIYAIDTFKDKPVRQALTRNLMICSLTAMHDVAEIIINKDHSKLSKYEWTYEVLLALNQMNSLFLNECQSRGIPQIVHTKYIVWYLDRLSHMRALVDQISASEMAPTAESKTSMLLLLFTLFITTMMGDCETTMHDLNGEITGIPFSGGTIEPLG